MDGWMDGWMGVGWFVVGRGCCFAIAEGDAPQEGMTL
jgi:hypothetical protein